MGSASFLPLGSTPLRSSLSPPLEATLSLPPLPLCSALSLAPSCPRSFWLSQGGSHAKLSAQPAHRTEPRAHRCLHARLEKAVERLERHRRAAAALSHR
eukprot:scaffold3548_cov24-Tisochrysis_lutea.AAC.2